MPIAAVIRSFARASDAMPSRFCVKPLYYYIPSKDLGISGIVAKPTPELLKLQADLNIAVAPFTVSTEDSTAFVTTSDDPVIDPVLIDYVSSLFRKAAASILVHMSLPAWHLAVISTSFSKSRLRRSLSRRRVPPFTNSASSAQRPGS
jgi:hypothetical protein